MNNYIAVWIWKILRGAGEQLLKGSPVNPSGQVQIGRWLKTVHLADTPHDPGQGSVHVCRMHDRSLGQSEFTVHSGLQFGGLPK